MDYEFKKEYSFYEIAKNAHNKRVFCERQESLNLKNQTKKAWNNFKFWARLNNNNDLSLKSFKKYLTDDFFGQNLAGYIIKSIYEVYYNFEFEWNVKAQKWVQKKI